MEKFSITAQLRDSTIKSDHVRAQKMTPSVIYGHNVPSQSLQVSTGELARLVRSAGMTHIIDLSIDGKVSQVLIHDIQRHPVTGDLIHVDFFAVSKSEKITVQLPVKIVGDSNAVREGAQLEQPIHHIEARLLASDLVDALEVDISVLVKSGDSVHISDIASKYPKIDFITPPENVIVLAKQFDEKALEEVATAETVAANEAKAEEKAA